MITQFKIPENVTITVDKTKLTVKGPKGEISKMFNNRSLTMQIEGDIFKVDSLNKEMIGTVIAHAKNMIKGVQEPYVKELIIRYHHFPITVEVKGKDIVIKNYLGERSSRKCKVYGDAKIEIKGKDILITSCNIEAVGQTAENIKRITRSKLDRRVFQDGIYDVLKG